MMKLRGRASTPDWSRGRTLSSSARGDTTDSHGTLQRWLEGLSMTTSTISSAVTVSTVTRVSTTATVYVAGAQPIYRRAAGTASVSVTAQVAVIAKACDRYPNSKANKQRSCG